MEESNFGAYSYHHSGPGGVSVSQNYDDDDDFSYPDY